VAIEFALIVPVLLMLLVGVVEVGHGVYQAMQVMDAAEAGGLYVAKHGWNSAAITAAVVNATGESGMTASPAPSQFCGCPDRFRNHHN
jgi:Flp pilus assembly protein TadG